MDDISRAEKIIVCASKAAIILRRRTENGDIHWRPDAQGDGWHASWVGHRGVITERLTGRGIFWRVGEGEIRFTPMDDQFPELYEAIIQQQIEKENDEQNI
jgi:hypothetical protein